MTTTDAPPLSQRDLAGKLRRAIDAVRDAVEADAWRVASADLARLIERAPSRDALRTAYIANAIGSRAEWLERWLAVR